MSDSEHLEWIYNRLIDVHGEDRRVDYMRRFLEVIKEVEK